MPAPKVNDIMRLTLMASNELWTHFKGLGPAQPHQRRRIYTSVQMTAPSVSDANLSLPFHNSRAVGRADFADFLWWAPIAIG